MLTIIITVMMYHLAKPMQTQFIIPCSRILPFSSQLSVWAVPLERPGLLAKPVPLGQWTWPGRCKWREMGGGGSKGSRRKRKGFSSQHKLAVPGPRETV